MLPRAANRDSHNSSADMTPPFDSSRSAIWSRRAVMAGSFSQRAWASARIWLMRPRVTPASGATSPWLGQIRSTRWSSPSSASSAVVSVALRLLALARRMRAASMSMLSCSLGIGFRRCRRHRWSGDAVRRSWRSPDARGALDGGENALAGLVADAAHAGQPPAPDVQQIAHLDDVDAVQGVDGGGTEPEFRDVRVDGRGRQQGRVVRFDAFGRDRSG